MCEEGWEEDDELANVYVKYKVQSRQAKKLMSEVFNASRWMGLYALDTLAQDVSKIAAPELLNSLLLIVSLRWYNLCTEIFQMKFFLHVGECARAGKNESHSFFCRKRCCT